MSTPPAPPPSPPRHRCEAVTANGVPCIAITKSGEKHCPNHDPAKAAQRRANAAKGAIRQGDPGTELGSIEGVIRRMARVVLDRQSGKLERAEAEADMRLLKGLLEGLKARDVAAGKNTVVVAQSAPLRHTRPLEELLG